jgi:hypothetical protein
MHVGFVAETHHLAADAIMYPILGSNSTPVGTVEGMGHASGAIWCRIRGKLLMYAVCARGMGIHVGAVTGCLDQTAASRRILAETVGEVMILARARLQWGYYRAYMAMHAQVMRKHFLTPIISHAPLVSLQLSNAFCRAHSRCIFVWKCW